MTPPAAGPCPTSKLQASWPTAVRLALPGTEQADPPRSRRVVRSTVPSRYPARAGTSLRSCVQQKRSMAMSEKRRALGRGLGALIPTAPVGDGRSRPMDVFFRDNSSGRAGSTATVSRETPMIRSDQNNGSRASELSTDPSAEQAGAGLGLAPVPGARYAELPVFSIRPNPRQPRKVFDDDEMTELVNSIREVGVLQPVVVRPIPAEDLDLSLIHISEPTRLGMISYAVFCL